jgi:hypothetical protein
MRFRPIALSALLAFAMPAMAQLSINFGGPGVSIGVNLPVYPTLQRVPGYPVYYAPSLNTNYFFYDGMYWVYDNDNWYASSWYNGPWRAVDRFYVPDYVLRVPVRYYRHAPAYFRGWRADAAPRWGEHWGASWEQRRGGWDRWNRSSAPAPAPLPTYQRQYSGTRYPQGNEQAVINTRNYRYQPKDTVAREQFQYQRSQVQAAPAPQPQRQQVAPQPQQQPPQPRQQRQQAPQPQQTQQAPQQQQQPRQQRQQAPQPQQTQQAPQPQPQQRQQREQRQQAPQPQQKQQAPQPQQKQQAPQPQQANPAARREAPQPQAAPDQRGQGKGQEQGKGKGKEKDKE